MSNRKRPSESLADFIKRNVVINSNGCWIWLGGHNKKGYGICGDMLAHRVSYETFRGPLGDLLACHSCDNPPCVNPDHLFPGTSSDNQKDSFQKGRNSQFGSRNRNAAITEEDVVEIRRRRKSGETQSSIARDYGIGQTQVSNIVLGISWGHVA